MIRDRLASRIFIRISLTAIFLCLVLFLPAGTVRYWQAWLYMGLLLNSMTLITVYLLRHDRALLERRLRMGEKEKPQKLIIIFGFIVFLGLFVVPGFDFRYGWSTPPLVAIIIADIIFLLGYWIFFLSLKENPYASRLILVEEGQRVISSGPYAVVRHPMYSAILLIMGFTPLCLGSYWGMVMLLPLLLILILRILNEEKVLAENLTGYKEYLQKTEYRLVPGIW